MIRRTLAVGALTLVASAVPAVAFAGSYPAPQDSLSCSASQVLPGGTLTCAIGGPEGSSAQLQVTTSGANASIAGTVTSEQKVITDGSATFTVTAPDESGTLGLTALIDGVAVDTSTAIAAAAGEELSATGFQSTGLAIGAGALLVAGAGAVVIGARRRARVDA